MQARTIWFPDPRVLLLLYQPYKSNKKFLTKATKEWLIAQMILKELKLDDDLKISEQLTCLTYLRGLKIFNEKEGELNPTGKELIEKSLPYIFPEIFTEQQSHATTSNQLIELFTKSDKNWEADKDSPVVLKILSDASDLATTEGVFKKLKTVNLFLDESREIHEVAIQIKQKWKILSFDISDPFVILEKILEDGGLEIETTDTLSNYSQEPYRTDLVEFTKTKLRNEVLEFKLLSEKLLENNGQKNISTIIKDVRRSIESQASYQTNAKDSIEAEKEFDGYSITNKAIQVHKIGKFKESCSKLLGTEKPDSRNLELIAKSINRFDSMLTQENIFSTNLTGEDRLSADTTYQDQISMDVGLFALLYKFDKKIDVELLNIYLEQLAHSYNLKTLQQVIALMTPPLSAEGSIQKPLYATVLKINESDRIFTRSHTKWVWIRKLEQDINLLVEKLPNNSQIKKVEKLNNVILICFSLIANNHLEPEQTIEILRSINSIIKVAEEGEIRIEYSNITNNLENLYSGEIKRLDDEGLNIYRNLDPFKSQLISESATEQLVREVLEMCSSLANHNINILPILENHIIPSCIITHNLEILEEYKDLIRNADLKGNGIQKTISDVKKIDKITEPELFNISLKPSSTNLSRALDPAKYKIKVDSKIGYFIVKEVPSIETIIEILSKDSLSSIKGIDHTTNEVSDITRDEVIMKRFLIREKDIEGSDIIIAKLENLNDHFNFTVNSDPRIKYLEPKDGHENMIKIPALLFAEDISESTIFTTHYPIGREIALPFALNEAKYLYEKIKDERESLISQENSFLTLRPEEIFIKAFSYLEEDSPSQIKALLLPKGLKDKKEFEKIMELIGEVEIYLY